MIDTQASLWFGVAASAVVGGWAALADRRRARRTRLDHVGWVPWPLILLAALMVGAVCAALALKR